MVSQTVRFYEFGAFRIDLLSRVLLRDGKPLRLEPKVFDTLLVLVENHTRVVSKEEFMNAVWGPDIFIEEGSLVRNISLLRKTIAEGLGDTPCIATFPKRGYQFVAPVREMGAGSQSEPGVPVHGHVAATADNGYPRWVPLQIHPIAVVALSMAVLSLAVGYWFVRPLPAPVVRGHKALTQDGREKRGPLLTDGSKLYFEERMDGNWVLAVVPTAGGTLSTVPLPSSDVMISDIAPDGSNLIGWELVPGSAGGRLLVWPVAGGTPETLGGLRGIWPTWSPDKASIAYSDGVHGLFVAERHGENPRKVVSVEGCPLELRWSPDGRFLCFWQRDPRSELSSLWDVPAVGGQLHLLSTGWKYSGGVSAWTADGRYSLFAEDPAGGPTIWARRENCNPFRWRCREPIPIAAGLGVNAALLPSRDARMLFAIAGNYREDLARYDSSSRTFVPYLVAVPAADPDFSRDGKWVAYVRLPERTLWRSRLDGSHVAELTVSGAEVYSPRWSPDGEQIAYMTISAQKQYKACVVPVGGGQPRQLLPGAGEEGIPTWSREGNFVVFGDVLHGLHAFETAVHLLDLRSHRVTTLPGSSGLWTPRWSPDGRYIAALALGDESKGQLAICPALLLYDFRTHTWTRLAKVENILNLAWTRDSQYVYFHTGAPDAEMYRVGVMSKKVVPLASLKSLESEGDDWIGVAPDGSPLVMRATHIAEVYALDVQWP